MVQGSNPLVYSVLLLRPYSLNHSKYKVENEGTHVGSCAAVQSLRTAWSKCSGGTATCQNGMYNIKYWVFRKFYTVQKAVQRFPRWCVYMVYDAATV